MKIRFLVTTFILSGVLIAATTSVFILRNNGNEFIAHVKQGAKVMQEQANVQPFVLDDALECLCSSLQTIKVDVIKTPKYKLLSQNGLFSWARDVFSPSAFLFEICSKTKGFITKKSLVYKILRQVDGIYDALNDAECTYQDHDLGYLAELWCNRMHTIATPAVKQEDQKGSKNTVEVAKKADQSTPNTNEMPQTSSSSDAAGYSRQDPYREKSSYFDDYDYDAYPYSKNSRSSSDFSDDDDDNYVYRYPNNTYNAGLHDDFQALPKHSRKKHTDEKDLSNSSVSENSDKLKASNNRGDSSSHESPPSLGSDTRRSLSSLKDDDVRQTVHENKHEIGRQGREELAKQNEKIERALEEENEDTIRFIEELMNS